MALPKQHRLSDRKEFARVYRRGQRHGGAALLLRIARQPKTIPPRTIQAKAIGSKTVAIQSSPQPSPKAIALPAALSPSPSSSRVAPSRIAVVVSTKVHKRAVVRNRIRRQIQAAFQSLLPRLKSGRLIVITVKAGAVECDYYKFLQQLEQLLIKAEAIHGH